MILSRTRGITDGISATGTFWSYVCSLQRKEVPLSSMKLFSHVKCAWNCSQPAGLVFVHVYMFLITIPTFTLHCFQKIFLMATWGFWPCSCFKFGFGRLSRYNYITLSCFKIVHRAIISWFLKYHTLQLPKKSFMLCFCYSKDENCQSMCTFEIHLILRADLRNVPFAVGPAPRYCVHEIAAISNQFNPFFKPTEFFHWSQSSLELLWEKLTVFLYCLMTTKLSAKHMYNRSEGTYSEWALFDDKALHSKLLIHMMEKWMACHLWCLIQQCMFM